MVGFLVVRNPSANAGDVRDRSSIPGWEDSLEEGMATLQYSCLENPMDRGGWWPTVLGTEKESETTELTACTHTPTAC